MMIFRKELKWKRKKKTRETPLKSKWVDKKNKFVLKKLQTISTSIYTMKKKINKNSISKVEREEHHFSQPEVITERLASGALVHHSA